MHPQSQDKDRGFKNSIKERGIVYVAYRWLDGIGYRLTLDQQHKEVPPEGLKSKSWRPNRSSKGDFQISFPMWVSGKWEGMYWWIGTIMWTKKGKNLQAWTNCAARIGSCNCAPLKKTHDLRKGRDIGTCNLLIGSPNPPVPQLGFKPATLRLPT